jgi:hypothetical protein
MQLDRSSINNKSFLKLTKIILLFKKMTKNHASLQLIIVGSFSTTCEKCFFALKVNIYLQNMSIKGRLARFDKKNRVFSLFFVYSLSPSIINYACPNFRSTCAMALQYVFELSTLPSIPPNGHVGGLC